MTPTEIHNKETLISYEKTINSRWVKVSGDTYSIFKLLKAKDFRRKNRISNIEKLTSQS